MPIVVDHGGAGLIGLAREAGKAKGEAAAGPAIEALRQGLITGINFGYKVSQDKKAREDRKAELERQRLFQLERDAAAQDFAREQAAGSREFQLQLEDKRTERDDTRETRRNAREDARFEAVQGRLDRQHDEQMALATRAADRADREEDRRAEEGKAVGELRGLQIDAAKRAMAAEDESRARELAARAEADRSRVGLLDALDDEYTDPTTGSFAPDATYYTMRQKVMSGAALSTDELKLLPSMAAGGRKGYQRREVQSDNDLVAVAATSPKTFVEMYSKSATAVAAPPADPSRPDGVNTDQMQALAKMTGAIAQVAYSPEFMPSSGAQYFERLVSLRDQYRQMGVPELAAPLERRVQELQGQRMQNVVPQAIEGAEAMIRARSGVGYLEGVQAGRSPSRGDAIAFLSELDRRGITAQELSAYVANLRASVIRATAPAPAAAPRGSARSVRPVAPREQIVPVQE